MCSDIGGERRERIKLTPLTLEERTFAEDNYPVLQMCIRSLRLGEDHQDIAYLGYLHAVKKWFARPDLQQWTFYTIARQTIRSHVGNNRQKEGRMIRTVSLDDVIPGTDGLTYGNYVTYNNLNYLKGDTGMAMQIKYDVPIPEIVKITSRAGVETEHLVNFLNSAHTTMCMEFGDKKEAVKKAANLRNFKKRRNRDDFNVYRLDESVYVEKITKKERKLKDG